ncbi:hypothetical protein KGA66_00205 [Actinocrinis puniceicyclus]|uniref:Uncharacterized protein n=1 Tax=Actinocrinis puniceicyclus TaxID=977794 RepID=A0A8J7WIA6_9ACTN|nr:hypothetical protein [Actinocrinis puniceicyclus]MBS2961445.1 hypothetical protein [Actinocrinis puniceicyclus]
MTAGAGFHVVIARDTAAPAAGQPMIDLAAAGAATTGNGDAAARRAF